MLNEVDHEEVVVFGEELGVVHVIEEVVVENKVMENQEVAVNLMDAATTSTSRAGSCPQHHLVAKPRRRWTR